MWKEKLIKWFLKTEVEKVVEILKLFFYINYVILLHFLNSSWNIWLKSKRYTFVFIFKYHKLLHVHTYVHMYLVTFLHFSINFAFLSFFYFFFFLFGQPTCKLNKYFAFPSSYRFHKLVMVSWISHRYVTNTPAGINARHDIWTSNTHRLAIIWVCDVSRR